MELTNKQEVLTEVSKNGWREVIPYLSEELKMM